MEYLDVYDEYMNKTGTESRDFVHQNGLWHKTVHCWVYDDDKNVYFQIRANSGKLYTTASGHVLAGETVRDAFRREIKEEIGIDMDISEAKPIEITFWRQDKNKNGVPWHDRAFSHVYINKIARGFDKFHFQPEEVSGIVKINAQDCLDVLMGKEISAPAVKITEDGTFQINITAQDFLTAPDEIAIIKYGNIMHQIIKQ